MRIKSAHRAIGSQRSAWWGSMTLSAKPKPPFVSSETLPSSITLLVVMSILLDVVTLEHCPPAGAPTLRHQVGLGQQIVRASFDDGLCEKVTRKTAGRADLEQWQEVFVLR
jgi:hypothetical protein